MISCQGCGGLFPALDGPTHRYMDSSPGCWACYCEVLAREYSDFGYRRVHRLTVDAYAVQHPGTPSPQSVQSVALHLISLCGIFEENIELQNATRLISRAAKSKDRFKWLSPPPSMGELTVADVHGASNPDVHADLVREWARAAWSAWSDHHPTIERWLQESWHV